jgi:hypothetical protein
VAQYGLTRPPGRGYNRRVARVHRTLPWRGQSGEQLQVEAIRRFGDGPIDSGKHPTSDDLRRGLVLAHRSFSLSRSCCWSSFLARHPASRNLPFRFTHPGWRRFAHRSVRSSAVSGAGGYGTRLPYPPKPEGASQHSVTSIRGHRGPLPGVRTRNSTGVFAAHRCRPRRRDGVARSSRPGSVNRVWIGPSGAVARTGSSSGVSATRLTSPASTWVAPVAIASRRQR